MMNPTAKSIRDALIEVVLPPGIMVSMLVMI